jgi:hypothetical protein
MKRGTFMNWVNGCVTKGSYFQFFSNWHAKNRGCNLLNKSQFYNEPKCK